MGNTATEYAVDAKVLAGEIQTQCRRPIVIDVILNEGAITVGAVKTILSKGAMIANKTYTFATPVVAGDLIQLTADDAGITYEACQGRIVVEKASSTGGAIGRVLQTSGPLVENPATTGAADTLAKRLAGKYYRVVPVVIYADEYVTVPVDGSNTAITVAGYLTWDVSATEYVKAGSSGMMACHHAAADSLNVGALINPTTILTTG
jgi:hypothetical protein